MNNDYLFTIQSANRPHKVKEMVQVVGPNLATKLQWIVPGEQVSSYKEAAGLDSHIFGVEGKLPMKAKQLNYAKRLARSLGYDYFITCDDDLKSVKTLLIIDGKKKLINSTIEEMIESIIRELNQSSYMLGGVPPTVNGLYMSGNVKSYGMTMGGFCVHRSSSDLFFDENLKSNEDLEFSIANHVKYGGVIRDEKFGAVFEILGKTKKIVGGYEGYRNDETETWNAKYITEKYKNPNIIVEYKGQGINNYGGVKFRKLKLDFESRKGGLESLFASDE